jgi:predicted transcriptional regulator of viral defense system
MALRFIYFVPTSRRQFTPPFTSARFSTERFVMMISDMERTIIDGLRHPAFAGGVTEVAKGLWMNRDELKVEQVPNATFP